MKRTKIYMKNKKQKGVFNKTSKLSRYFTSILKLNIAIALFFIAALVTNAAGVIVDSKDGYDSVISGYGGVDEKVYILPFAAPDYIKPDPSKEERDRVRKNYNLPERLLFYASNIHGPKNHLGLLRML